MSLIDLGALMYPISIFSNLLIIVASNIPFLNGLISN